MRILQISSARTFGGGERHFVDLCRGLQERGHEIFVALRPSNEWQGRLGFIPPENFLYVSIRNSFGMFSAQRIGHFLIDNRIDIVHAHVARDYIAASIAGRISKNTNFVLTRHVMFAMKPFHKLALRNVRAAIAVSPPVAAQLARIFPAEKIHVIPNGLDIADHADVAILRREFREFHEIPPDVLVVGTLGELKLLKGQRDLILAANEIAKTDPDCRFVIVGTDNSADGRFRRELRRLVKVFGLEDRFLWLGQLEDTAPFFSAIDIFVSPSHSESFGLAMLEAMARGKAVVATETDGARELMSGTGVLTPINDPLSLAEAVSGLLADPDRCRSIGDKLQMSALDRFSVARMIDATESLYRKVAATA
jgi:glycosyltransferase involved in cell wall biosynthesis